MAQPAAAEEQQAVYTMNWVINPDRKGVIVMTNSDLPVVKQCKGIGPEFPCHDSHMPVRCSAQMVGTQAYGTPRFVLKLTSPIFDGQIFIEYNYDPSFLDLFIGGDATEVLFPMPLEKPTDCCVIMSDDMKGKIVLTNQSLPSVPMKVLVADIPNIPNSKTPNFNETDDGSVFSCALPTGCLSVMPCHDGYVPVRCSGKIVWSQTSGPETKVIMSLSSELLETPIYVSLDQFIKEKGNQLFFLMPIQKELYEVENKQSFNHPALKGMSRDDKQEAHEEQDPIPNSCYRQIQKPNQIWSIWSNKWVLIRKPKPRRADWKWDDSIATWVCQLDPTNGKLKIFDRSKYSNCFGGCG
jgi:hypothetical protein